MTSTDGINWSLQNLEVANNWSSVTYGNGTFVAVANSGTGKRVVISTNKTTPNITNFSIPTKTYNDASFEITQPDSDSSGSFTYNSSNTSVATISGNTITIVGAGTSTITAIQEETSNYYSGTITTTFQFIPVVNNVDSLLNFLNTSESFSYVNITDSLEINYDLISSNYKVLTGNNIKITKLNIL